jgi:isoamylase
MPGRLRVGAGERFPNGATATGTGVNFSIFSRHATAAWLELFERADDHVPLQTVALDPRVNRTFFFWHVFVEGAQPGLYYAWRLDGPNDPSRGLRFDPTRELLDPWATIVSDRLWDRSRAAAGEPAAIRACVAGADDYDWEGDAPLQRPLQDSIIYELHVGGFTRDPSSGVAAPGTYAGLIEKIPYLTELGITDVELLPTMAFDAEDVPPGVAARGLRNYWGYSPYGFFAPHPHYAAGADARREFRDMVKALHRAGIGVILDVVLNHTAEGGDGGVTISFKGWGNEFFYHLDPADKSRYRDFTGCGNTINCNHPLVAHFLLQCLGYWVGEMHVDGFRLDLASVLTRGEDGEPMYHAPLLWSIEFSRVLASTHLIAEAWDASGLHQVGAFPGFRWSEWNGLYRDTIRRFLRGDGGMIGEAATRIAGSSDLFGGDGGHPVNGINFVTCHDGFTLHDLVSYDRKHNEGNGEDNRDGTDDNFSWNSGAEGPTDDAAIEALRLQRAKSFVAVLMLSQGVPMLLYGDEVLRSQRGNNNAYCQDNPIGWFDWTAVEREAEMLRFTREMIALRRRHRSLRRTHFVEPEPADGLPEITWHGDGPGLPDWHEGEARLLRFTIAPVDDGEPPLHAMINMSDVRVRLSLPVVGAGRWHRIVDTWRRAPDDVCVGDEAQAVSDYMLAARAVAVFELR